MDASELVPGVAAATGEVWPSTRCRGARAYAPQTPRQGRRIVRRVCAGAYSIRPYRGAAVFPFSFMRWGGADSIINYQLSMITAGGGIINNYQWLQVPLPGMRGGIINNYQLWGEPRRGVSAPRVTPSEPRRGVSDTRKLKSEGHFGVSDPRMAQSEPHFGVSDPRKPCGDPHLGLPELFGRLNNQTTKQ